MYKVKIEDLETILKTLKSADRSLKSNKPSMSTRMQVINTIKLIERDYLHIKAIYNQSNIE